MSQQPFDGPNDMMLIGEFCEKDGPVVRELWGLDNEPINIHDIPGAPKAMHTFMMRAMSGDHVYPESAESPLQCRSCEVLMDRVKWIDGSMMVAYVCSVTLYDLHARGYARTACIAYLSNDDHKMFAISHWLSLECQTITKTFFDATLERHKRELVRGIDALERAKAAIEDTATNSSENAALTSRITDRHRSALGSELDALKARVLRLPELAAALAAGPAVAATPTSTTAPRRKTMTKLAQTMGGASNPTSPEEVLNSTSAGGILHGRQPSASFESRVAELRNSSLNASSDSGYVYRPVTDDEVIDTLDALITKKGIGELRTLAVVCGFDAFETATQQIRRTVWTFSQDTVWLMENVLQVMMPLARVLERPLGELLTANWTWTDAHSSAGTPSEGGRGSGAQPTRFPTDDKKSPAAAAAPAVPASHSPPNAAFYFKIGDCLVVEPSLRLTPPFPPMNSLTAFTMIHEETLFQALKEHGVAPMLAVMFSALRCVPIVVCGDDVEDVASAMRIAATFVPGLFQSASKGIGAAMCNFPMKHRVAPEHLLAHALIGCPSDAILFEGKPIYPAACAVWHVQKAVRDRKGLLVKSRTATLFAQPYNVAGKGQAEHRAVPAAFVDPFGLDAVHVPVGVGLLHEVHDILTIRSTSPAEGMALSNFLRLTLKRVFLEYGTMAALAMQSLVHDTHLKSCPSLNSGHIISNTSITTPGGGIGTSAIRISFSNVSMTTVYGPGGLGPVLHSHHTPHVITEGDVRTILETQHGYHQLHNDDVSIVTGMLGRMMALALEFEKKQ